RGSRNTVVVEGEMPPRFVTLATATVPSLYAAQALRDALEHAGIAVRGTTRVNTTPHAWSERIAAIESPFVTDLLAITLKPSQNLYAETLFKDLSADGEPASY